MILNKFLSIFRASTVADKLVFNKRIRHGSHECPWREGPNETLQWTEQVCRWDLRAAEVQENAIQENQNPKKFVVHSGANENRKTLDSTKNLYWGIKLGLRSKVIVFFLPFSYQSLLLIQGFRLRYCVFYFHIYAPYRTVSKKMPFLTLNTTGICPQRHFFTKKFFYLRKKTYLCIWTTTSKKMPLKDMSKWTHSWCSSRRAKCDEA